MNAKKILDFINSYFGYYIFCFGGFWIKMTNFKKYKCQCYDFGECCDITGNYCNVYCFNNIMYCDCCCCYRSCCFSPCCDKYCNTFECCECCGENNEEENNN